MRLLLIMILVSGCSSLAKIQKKCKEDPQALGYYDSVECIRGERRMKTDRWNRFVEGYRESVKEQRDRETTCRRQRNGDYICD